MIGLALFLSITALQGAVSVPNAAGQDAERRELFDAAGLTGLFQARPTEPEDESAFTSCPEGYPSFGKLGELLRAWSPNEPEEPAGAVEQRLQVIIIFETSVPLVSLCHGAASRVRARGRFIGHA